MNDRELLELAAKAAGLNDLESSAFGFHRVIGEHMDGMLCMVAWNPLTDDGDALRLAVRLSIDINIYQDGIDVVWIDEDISESHSLNQACDETYDGIEAKYAATRRAIVRAAAEIGMSE